MALVLDGDNGIVGVLATNADGDVIIDTNTFFVDAPNNRVGIGTLTPEQKLHVNGITKSDTGMMFGGTESYLYESAADVVTLRVGSNGPYMRLGSDNGEIGNSSGTTHLIAGTGGSELVLTTSGNVGIGTDTPGYALDVKGGTATGNGARIKTGDNGYDGLIVSSSSQLKSYPSAGTTVKLTGYNSSGSTRDGVVVTTANTPYGEISTNIQSVTELMGHFVNDGSSYGTANDKYVDLEDWSPADFRILEIFGTANPNSGGSGSYADPIHMYVYNGSGWNGASVTYYVYGHSIAPTARSVYSSGSGSSANSDVEVFWKSPSAEQDAVTSGTASDYHLRLYFPNVNTTYGTNINLRVIKRA